MQGSQRPRVYSAPAYSQTSAQEAFELAELAGVELDPWQKFVLTAALGEREDGNWAAPEVGLVCPRQNGKNAILEVRELSALYLFREKLFIHSAHQYDTSIEAFLRLWFLIENTPELLKRVKRRNATHGEEGIELHPLATVSIGPGGLVRSPAPRIRFRTRTKGGGRGFAAPGIAFDEAMMFPEASLAAIMPVVSAQPNPQVWYTGSAVDQSYNENGVVLTRVRQRGLAGDDPRLAYFEWSVDRPRPEDVEFEFAADPEAWAEANPALGIRITEEYVAGERAAMGPRNFAVERLGVGDWPSLEDEADVVIPTDTWRELTDKSGEVTGEWAFAFDVTPDRAWGSIGVSGWRADGLTQVEVVEHRRGTGWIIPWLADRKGDRIICDARGPAGSLLPELERAGVTVEPVTSAEHAKACGLFYDAVMEGTLHHLGDPLLAAAVAGAKKRPLGDAWLWDRRTSSVIISPLVAVTLAAYGAQTLKPKRTAPRLISLSD